jgi:hypothetical protein
MDAVEFFRGEVIAAVRPLLARRGRIIGRRKRSGLFSKFGCGSFCILAPEDHYAAIDECLSHSSSEDNSEPSSNRRRAGAVGSVPSAQKALARGLSAKTSRIKPAGLAATHGCTPGTARLARDRLRTPSGRRANLLSSLSGIRGAAKPDGWCGSQQLSCIFVFRSPE